jgi:hypothetical protein
MRRNHQSRQQNGYAPALAAAGHDFLSAVSLQPLLHPPRGHIDPVLKRFLRIETNVGAR